MLMDLEVLQMLVELDADGAGGFVDFVGAKGLVDFDGAGSFVVVFGVGSWDVEVEVVGTGSNGG